jgi:RHS repeat-associated protein
MRREIVMVALLATLAGGGQITAAVAAKAAWAPPVPKDVVSIPVTDSTARSGIKLGDPPRVTEPPAVTWPADTTAEIQPGETMARAAGAPVSVASRDGTVGVRVRGRADTARAGVSGVLLDVARDDGVTAPDPVRVALDYSGFAGAYGGDWATRLRLVQLPACALTTPGVTGCGPDGATPVTSANIPATHTLTADVTLPADGSPVMLATVAGASGGNGDYTATSLTPASSWQVSQQTGAFSWSYPLRLPSAVGGPTPVLSLSYSSQSVDGRTGGTNSQGSWVGDGWDLWSGYIERTYKSCAQDTDAVGGKDPNNKDRKTGDQCWWKANATLSLNGRSTELIDVGGGRWKGVSDDGSRVELTGNTWKVTTLDGTQYFFGRNAASKSTWNTQVYGNHPGEPGYVAGDFAASRQTQPWRWNLDYVVDPSGNTMTLFYETEQGAYGREADPGKRTTYDRGGWLSKIAYGTRADQAQPSAQVLFDVADRCLPGATCFDSNGKAVAASWPDTPWDRFCPPSTQCTEQLAPTFWTQKRLSQIRSQIWDAAQGQFRTIESWALKQSYLNAGSSQGEGVPMWLDSITRTGTGVVGAAAVTDPPITFSPGQDPFPNRVDGPADGSTALNRFRVVAITTESGAQIGVSYLPGDCTRSALPSPATNTKRCMPQYYSPDGAEPKLDWFHKYVVSRIDLYDNTGGFQHEQYNYDYLDTPAWHYDDSELVEEKKRTWGQWRGYGRVRVRTGLESGPQASHEYRYFRGMDGDKADSGVKDVWIKDSLDGTGDPHSKAIEDHDALSGQLREEIVYDGVGGAWLTGSLTEPAFTQTGSNAQGGPLKSYMTHIAVTLARTHLTWNDTTRWTKVTTKVNGDNLPIESDDLGDETTAADDLCTKTSYAVNDTAWLRDRVAETDLYGVSCATTPSLPGDVVSMSRKYYDNPDKPFGTAPTRGLVVKTEEAGSWSGTTPQWVTTGTSGYDANGRTITSADALGNTTTTAYTPVTAGPVTSVKVTNPAGQATTKTMEIAYQLPKLISDPNGTRTELVYDGTGRLTAVWLPSRDRATQGANLLFSYSVTGTSPAAITTKRLLPNGTNRYLTSVAIFDGLLRERQSQTQAVGGGRLISDTVRDSRGLVSWTSAPYYQDASAPTGTLVTPAVAIPAVTEKVYDGANRLVEERFKANGAVKWKTVTTYGGDRVTVVPPAGGIKTDTLTDARGRSVELRQYKSPTSTDYDRTAYTYTDRGDLASITDQAGNVWRSFYDQRGRKIRTEDPDKGATENTYDAAGHLATVKDARGVVVAYTYDSLGRKTSLREGSASGAKRAEWTYDTAPNGVGKPAGSVRYDGTKAYASEVTGYDTGGNPLGTRVVIPAEEGALAGSYEFPITYKPDGQPATLGFPAMGGLPAETLTFGYSAVGNPTFLMSGSQIYVNDVIYNQLGKLIQRILGQGDKRVWETDTIDEPTGRLTSTSVVPELKSEVYDLNYTYDDAGNITRIADTPNGGQPADYQCFAVDYLKRLTEAWTPSTGDCQATRSVAGLGGPSPYWQSITYTTTGSRDVETWHAATNTVRDYVQPAQGGPAGSKPHTVSRVDKSGAAAGSDTFLYDAAGNTTSRVVNAATTTLTWDNEGALATTLQGGQTTSYLYDADGNRLLRRDPGSTTLYLPNGVELKATGSTVTGTHYYSHLGRLIAVRTPASLCWTAQDHHNTSEALIKATDLSVSRRRSMPFGAPRGAAPATWVGDKGFVGGTTDPSGLTHLGAREYDPLLGAFISVDPIIDPGDPQQLHAYSYSNGNPVTMTDPDGRWPSLPSWVPNPVKAISNAVSSTVSAVGNVATSAGKWVYNNAGTISAVSGVLAIGCSLIPPLQVAAPFFGAVATVTGALDTVKSCKEGKAVDCAVGAASLIPGASVMRLAKPALRAEKMLKGAEAAVRDADQAYKVAGDAWSAYAKMPDIQTIKRDAEQLADLNNMKGALDDAIRDRDAIAGSLDRIWKPWERAHNLFMGEHALNHFTEDQPWGYSRNRVAEAVTSEAKAVVSQVTRGNMWRNRADFW